MAITVRQPGRFRPHGRADWRYWLGAAALGSLVLAAGIYFLGDTDEATAPVTRPALDSPAQSLPGAPAADANTPSFIDRNAGVIEAPIVYIVGSQEHFARTQLALAEADAVRYSYAQSPVGGEIVVVDEASTADFMAAIAEANTMRGARGLPPLSVIDLR